MANKAKEYFKIVYEGGEADKREITVRDLAPSLLAFSDFIDHANNLINGKKVRVDLKFRASGEGSIIVELGLNVDLLSQIVDFFKGDAITALLNLKEVLGIAGGGFGIFKIIKWIRNRNIHQVKVKEDQKVVLILEDEERLDITEHELKVLRSVKARKSLAEFSKPINTKSASKISIYENKSSKAEENSISENEVEYFEAPDVPDELINKVRQDVVITIDSLCFKEGNKWRVSDGSQSYIATISDERFLKDVQNNVESFRRDDILRVDMVTKQFRTSGGLKTEHEILKVKDHIPPSDQISLDFE